MREHEAPVKPLEDGAGEGHFGTPHGRRSTRSAGRSRPNALCRHGMSLRRSTSADLRVEELRKRLGDALAHGVRLPRAPCGRQQIVELPDGAFLERVEVLFEVLARTLLAEARRRCRSMRVTCSFTVASAIFFSWSATVDRDGLAVEQVRRWCGALCSRPCRDGLSRWRARRLVRALVDSPSRWSLG